MSVICARQVIYVNMCVTEVKNKDMTHVEEVKFIA